MEACESETILERVPKEVGAMLLAAGVAGMVLPGPGVPLVIAGGMVLWPRTFRPVRGWFRDRFPEAYRAGLGHIDRFVADFERRYPGATARRIAALGGSDAKVKEPDA